MCSLWSIRLVIFANQALKHMISHIQQSNVRTGIANALGEFFICYRQNIIKIALVKVHLTVVIFGKFLGIYLSVGELQKKSSQNPFFPLLMQRECCRTMSVIFAVEFALEQCLHWSFNLLILGNKGGVGISFSLGQVSLCFVNCHLAARGTPARVLR